MFDMTQMVHQRRMVKRGDEFWLVCYVVSTIQPEDTNPGKGASLAEFKAWSATWSVLALAVPCNEYGDVDLPAATHLISFVDADMVNPTAR